MTLPPATCISGTKISKSNGSTNPAHLSQDVYLKLCSQLPFTSWSADLSCTGHAYAISSKSSMVPYHEHLLSLEDNPIEPYSKPVQSELIF